MRPRLSKIVEVVKSSYWFVPALMAILSLVLGGLMVWLDVRFGSDWLDGIGWYQMVKPEGAHEVLSTIAGSMITVAGVVFSITIVAIAYASSQFGPRVLTNFLADLGNKITLGTFIATFTYCLVVLRTIKGGDEGAFVPQMAVLVGLILAFCSIGVLIYFIHHVPQSIHINTVVARIGRQLIDDVGARFPDSIADLPTDAGATLPPRGENFRRVPAEVTGYIQAIDEVALIKSAQACDLVVRLRYRTGDYLFAGRTLLEASPAERVDDRAAETLAETFSVGTRRTPAGDLDFLVNELVEIATRALSSGINDPTTASTCIDWLGAGATALAQRQVPSSFRADKAGTLRLIVLPDGFAQYVERAFGRLRQYVARDMNASLHLLRTLGEIAAGCRTAEQIGILSEEAAALAGMADQALTGAAQARVRQRANALDRLLLAGTGAIDERQAQWLGGSL